MSVRGFDPRFVRRMAERIEGTRLGREAQAPCDHVFDIPLPEENAFACACGEKDDASGCDECGDMFALSTGVTIGDGVDDEVRTYCATCAPEPMQAVADAAEAMQRRAARS